MGRVRGEAEHGYEKLMEKFQAAVSDRNGERKERERLQTLDEGRLWALKHWSQILSRDRSKQRRRTSLLRWSVLACKRKARREAMDLEVG
jgi:hypothetical protein